ncbi:hypothetical protein [Acaryochloris sp. IP29b_bin.137]|uniref:hypothetical protein n=1 Tax=Acaryochloris sp. IP29b_bin.137 TaxID=2969217 RepID=UPI00262FC69C|nr:hypothetical protein [Acaryochloris sp. IP29b_bin.137]
MIGRTILTMIGLSLGMGGMVGIPQANPNPAPSTIARPPYNCRTREVWSPAKQAWCDNYGPSAEQDDWPGVARPDPIATEGDRNRYTTIALDTFPTHKPLHGADPKAIALSLIDLPAAEGNAQKRTSVSTKKGQSAAVMLSQIGLGDDSVQGIRYRLEFEPQGLTDGEAQWQLVWVGRQQLCWPGRGPEAWTNQPCI